MLTAGIIQWIDAHEQHRTGLAAFCRARFRSEFERPFAAWLATTPFTNRSAPKTPFDMPQYRLKAVAEADRLESVARMRYSPR
jgi:hypothetical protein